MSSKESSHKLAADFLWNISASAWGIFLALLATPYVVHRLGPESYGIYALLGVLFSYLAFTEIGLGRAVERYGAAALGEDAPERLRAYFSAALTLQSIVAVTLSSTLVLAGAPLLDLFEIPPEQRGAAEAALSVVAVSFGINLLLGTAQAPLRAHRAFSTLNRISLVAQTVTTGLTVAAAWWRPTVVYLVGALAVASAFRLLLVLTVSCRRIGLPRPTLDRDTLGDLLGFGGALTLSSLLSPILAHAEKLLLGVLVGTAALTYYVVPFRVLSKLGLVSGALSRALFPWLSRLEGEGRRESMWTSSVRSTELLFWLLAPAFTGLWIAGDALLTLWMGAGFAARSAPVLPWLVTGMFVNLLAWNAVGLIQARGRPMLVTWAYVAEAVVYLPLAWWLMQRYGLTGAAVAWMVRMTLDAVLLWTLAARLGRGGPGGRPTSKAWALPATVLVVALGLTCRSATVDLPWLRVACGTLAGLAVVAVAWTGGLLASERGAVRRLLPW